MVLFGSEPAGLHPLGGAIVQIGTGTPPYTPSAIYADQDAFKATWGVMEQNYLVYDYDNSPPSSDSSWNDYNIDPVFSFDILGGSIPVGGGSTKSFTYSYGYSY